MQKLDGVFVPNDSAPAGLGESFGGYDLPVVVLVCVAVAGDLLALGADAAVVVAQGVLLRVRVQEDFGVFVADGDCVVVPDF